MGSWVTLIDDNEFKLQETQKQIIAEVSLTDWKWVISETLFSANLLALK